MQGVGACPDAGSGDGLEVDGSVINYRAGPNIWNPQGRMTVWGRTYGGDCANVEELTKG